MYSSKHQEIDVDKVMLDVVEEVVRLSVVESSLETLRKYFEQRPNDALSHIMIIQGLHEEISSHHLEASCQTTIDFFFWLV
jgi:citrate lyase beta subunit